MLHGNSKSKRKRILLLEGFHYTVRNGIIGPQEENGVIYPGGNQQYEIICTKDMRWRDDGWEDYLQEISRKELK